MFTHRSVFASDMCGRVGVVVYNATTGTGVERSTILSKTEKDLSTLENSAMRLRYEHAEPAETHRTVRVATTVFFSVIVKTERSNIFRTWPDMLRPKKGGV
jgi:hypothetical protein